MAIRRILEDGDPTLRKISRPVIAFNKRLWELLDDMHETLKQANGAGLAGPQVGVLRQVAIVLDDDGSFFEIINPRILSAEGEQDDAEGCLSLPGVYGYVKRPMKITVEGKDRYGNRFVRDAEGFTARAFCHEIDHLSGCMFMDKVSRYLTKEELEQL